MVSQEQLDVKKLLQIMLPYNLHMYVEFGMKLMRKQPQTNSKNNSKYKTKSIDNYYIDHLIFNSHKCNNEIPSLSSFLFER